MTGASLVVVLGLVDLQLCEYSGMVLSYLCAAITLLLLNAGGDCRTKALLRIFEGCEDFCVPE